MSSHHFVKEQQEPAVFILNTEGVSIDHVGPMLEWVPTVIVTEAAFEKVISWGIKVDVLIASDAFRKDQHQLLESQQPLKVLTQNESVKWLEEGLHYLQASDHKAAHLVGYPMADFQELNPLLDRVNLTFIDDGWKYFPVRHERLSKWFNASNIRLLGRENLPIQLSNEEENRIIPNTFLTQIDMPEGLSTLEANEIFWIGQELKQAR